MLKILTLLGVTVGAVGMLTAPTAHADYTDEQVYGYIGLLERYHVTYGSIPSAVALGDQACIALRSGADPISYLFSLRDRVGKWPAASVLNGATSYLCPDMEPIVQQAIRNRPPDIP